jgi:hypothetical protein
MSATTSSQYIRGALLGEGTYGSVFSAMLGEQRVAIKRVKAHEVRPGMNFTALVSYIEYTHSYEPRKVCFLYPREYL